MIKTKKKGNKGENNFANWLKDNGIKAWKDGMSGGGNREKADVGNNINANFEVKTVKAINLHKAWQQTTKCAEMTHNTPYLVIHFDGMPENSWLMVIDNWDWLEIFKKSQGDKIVEYTPEEDSREKKYKIQRAIQALKELLKFYD